jgi:quercetin dioxygenase-like cupin family protein
VLHHHGRAGTPTRRDVGKCSGEPVAGVMSLDTLLEAGNVRVNAAVFQPGSRTWWHFHTEGQLFLVDYGRGIVANRSGDVRVVEAGDLVYTPPGEEHWHGAAPDSIVVYTSISLGDTNFLDEVLEEAYAQSWRSVSAVTPTPA